jgi:hypothetical protein
VVRRIIVGVFLVVFLFSLAADTWKPAYADETTIAITPDFLVMPPGSTTTVAVTVADVDDLYIWEVIVEYNASVANCSSAWIPSDNVFQGHSYLESPTMYYNLINLPSTGGLSYLIYGASLTSSDYVDVTFGTLFNINYTGLEDGLTTLRIVTIFDPISGFSADWYSYLCDSNFQEMPFVSNDGCAVVGSENVTVSPMSDLGLTFANVTGPGAVAANKTSVVEAPPLANLTGQYYEIKVTASYVGNVTVRLAYDDLNMTPTQEESLQMMQYTPIPGDISPPYGQLDMRDIGYVCRRFLTNSSSPLWDPAADITGPEYLVPDGLVDMRDIGFIARWFGGRALWINITVYVDTVDNVIYGVTNHFSFIGIH